MPYDIEEHRHRFGAWAAARASQRGCSQLSTAACYTILTEMRPAFAEYFSNEPSDQATFDSQHARWVKQIQHSARHVRFGRAAKLLNIYLKVVFVLSDNARGWRDMLHPPIDGFLMKAAARDERVANDRRWLEKAAWTKFQQPEYDRALKILRQLGRGWKIEEHWHPVKRP